MAQKTGKEETEFEVVPEAITLCVKCGVAGNSSANNLCQKCFNTTAASSSTSSVATAGERSFRSSSCTRFSPERRLNSANISRDLKKETTADPAAVAYAPPLRRAVNRCSGCRKKVGLTGFRCRCGDLFCADHRYSDRHDCSYDYKTVGREAIAKENPLVKAAKIVKI